MDKLNRIVIVVPKGELVLSSIAGSYKLFKAAIAENDKPVELLIAGDRKRHYYLDGLFSVTPSIHWKDIKKADLIIVPAVKEGIADVLTMNKKLMVWLKDQYEKGAHVASLCTGSFLLAKSGLLDNKRCTTHWAFTEEFNEMFKNTLFAKNNVITEDNRIYTSGGAYSFLSLIVYLVEVLFSKEIARKLVNIYQIDYNRKSQEQFVVFNTQKSHSDEGIKQAQEYIERNYARKISNEKLADVAKLGTRTMVRRFKAFAGNTPNECIQRVRTEAAKDFLISSDKQITEIQYAVGYNDPKTFRDIFLRYTGCAPMEYRRKYGTKI